MARTREAMATDRRTEWSSMLLKCVAELKALNAEEDQPTQTSTQKQSKSAAA
jgi:hypothetical protein